MQLCQTEQFATEVFESSLQSLVHHRLGISLHLNSMAGIAQRHTTPIYINLLRISFTALQLELHDFEDRLVPNLFARLDQLQKYVPEIEHKVTAD